jgi:hypothetical protein
MATRNLDRSEWQGFFDGLSRLLEGKQADIRVESLAIGSQMATKWLRLLGITYDPKDDLLEVALEGVDHMIRKPQRISAEVGTEGLRSLEIVDSDAVRQLVELREPLMLPAPAST